MFNVELAESHVSKVRLWSILYFIGIILLYVIYRFFIVDGTQLKNCSFCWLIDAGYWIVSTIVINIINHQLFIKGFLSFFSKKYKQNLISNYLQDRSSKK